MTVSISSLGKYHDITKYRYIAEHYVAKDPDVAQTMEADSTAISRVCVNLGAAEEEDSDDVMDDSDNS